MSGKLPLVSADSHVFEPATLWRERLPARYRDRGPRVVEAGGWHVLAVEGMPDRKLGRAGAAVPGGGAEGGIGTRLADLAHDGVVAEVVYPTLGLFIDMIPDPGLQVACAAVYNDWAAETFLGQPDVFVPVAVVPVRDVGLGVAELERAVGMGFRAAMIPTTPPEGTRYNQPVFDPLWEAAAGAGVPLSLHTGTGALPQSERGPGGAIINYAKVGLLSAETLCYLAASGVLERHPGLRLVFVETGAGWLAYCLERMDEAHREHALWVDPKLAAPPSEYVRRQCYVTLGAERAPVLTRGITGVGPLLWASDYPHPEGTFPNSQAVVARLFADLPGDEVRAITAANAAHLYGLSLP